MPDYFVDPVNGNDASAGGASSPLATLRHAETLATDGDKVVVRPGLLRLAAPVTTTKAITFVLEGVISGAVEVAAAWEYLGDGLWRAPWGADWPALPEAKSPAMKDRRECVIIDGQMLERRPKADELQEGQVAIEGPLGAPSHVVVRLPGSPGPMELAATELAFDLDGAALVGGEIRHFNPPRQKFAVLLSGEGPRLQHTTIRECNGGGFGLSWWRDGLVEDVTCHRNGIEGWGGTGPRGGKVTGLRIIENGIHDPQYGQGHGGGGKVTRSSEGFTIEHSVFLRNRGSGIWMDINNRDFIIRHCTVRDCYKQGIFLENQSVGGLIQDCTVTGIMPHPLGTNAGIFPGVGVAIFAANTAEDADQAGITLHRTSFGGNALDLFIGGDERGHSRNCRVLESVFGDDRYMPLKVNAGGKGGGDPEALLASHTFAGNLFARTSGRLAYTNVGSRYLDADAFGAMPWSGQPAVSIPTPEERALQEQVEALHAALEETQAALVQLQDTQNAIRELLACSPTPNTSNQHETP